MATAHRHFSTAGLRRRVAIPLLALAAAFLLAACSGGAASTGGERSADAAPDFELVLFETENHEKGEKIHLSQFEGQPVLLNFWFPSCPPCRAEMPDLEQAFQNHKDDVVFIGIQNMASDSIAEGQEFVTEVGVTYALGPDEDNSILLDYVFSGFPTTYFLDKDHRIVRKWTGQLNGEKLEEFVQELLN